MLPQLDGQGCGGLSGGPGTLWRVLRAAKSQPRAPLHAGTPPLWLAGVGLAQAGQGWLCCHRLDRGGCAVTGWTWVFVLSQTGQEWLCCPRLLEGLGPHRDITAWGQGVPLLLLELAGCHRVSPGCHPAGPPGCPLPHGGCDPGRQLLPHSLSRASCC